MKTNCEILEEKAIEAALNADEKRRTYTQQSDLIAAKNCFEQFKEVFPELQLSGGHLILCGHKFRPYPTGTYCGGKDNGKTAYSLDPILRSGGAHWIYNLETFGQYLLWYKNEYPRELEEKKIRKETKYLDSQPRGFFEWLLD